MKAFSVRLHPKLEEVFEEYRKTVQRSNNVIVTEALEEFFRNKGLFPTEEELLEEIKTNGNKQKIKPSN